MRRSRVRSAQLITSYGRRARALLPWIAVATTSFPVLDAVQSLPALQQDVRTPVGACGKTSFVDEGTLSAHQG